MKGNMKAPKKQKHIYQMGNGYLVKIGRVTGTGLYFGPADYSDPLQAALMARGLVYKELGVEG